MNAPGRARASLFVALEMVGLFAFAAEQPDKLIPCPPVGKQSRLWLLEAAQTTPTVEPNGLKQAS
jgi:hypothetical protein